MKRSVLRPIRWAGLAALLGVLFGAAPAARAEQIDTWFTRNGDGGYTAYFLITQPNVSQPRTDYPGLWFLDGERVTVLAWGCYQRGGRGKTWVRYVDPQGPRSVPSGDFPGLYHGMTNLGAGAGPLVRIRDVWGWEYTVNVAITPHLVLGLVDEGYPNYSDAYSDNGYWGRDSIWTGRDDGLFGQCQGLGDATVLVVIRNPEPKSPFHATAFAAAVKRSPVAATLTHKGRPFEEWFRAAANPVAHPEAVEALGELAAQARPVLPRVHDVLRGQLATVLEHPTEAVRGHAAAALKRLDAAAKGGPAPLPDGTAAGHGRLP